MKGRILIAAMFCTLLAQPAAAQFYDANEPSPADAGANASPMMTDGNLLAQPQDNDGAQAQPQAQTMTPTTQRVTSLQKCIDQLDPDDQAEVRLNAIRPYQECMNRLADKAAKRRHIKVSRERAAEEEEVAETPRNFSRVQERTASGRQQPADETNYGHWSAASAGTAKPAPRRPVADNGPPPDSAEEIENPAAPRKKKTSEKSQGGGISGFFSSIKPDNSKANYNN